MFSFKQFTIRQDQTAMKVCTDACILGAYTPVQDAERVLDIGTGTGLLSLMLAQRNVNAQIDAVEIEPNAYQQAVENVKNSPFFNQISVFNQAIQRFSEVFSEDKNHDKTRTLLPYSPLTLIHSPLPLNPSATSTLPTYDLIISNPPFFNNHLKSPQKIKNQALHTDSLSFEDLLNSVLKLLKPSGTFVVLLPEYESSLLEKLALNVSLFPVKRLVIKHREEGKIFRIITTFTFEETEILQEELIIKNPDESYSPQFIDLLKDYYLIF
jgi:tRNA1Val (adenine37-N6)-methyltransferase